MPLSEFRRAFRLWVGLGLYFGGFLGILLAIVAFMAGAKVGALGLGICLSACVSFVYVGEWVVKNAK